VAIFAVLKSGAQYVPLDAVTTQRQLLGTIPFATRKPSGSARNETNITHRVQLIRPYFGRRGHYPCRRNSPTLMHQTRGRDVPFKMWAYAVYTSGTTEWPKGVECENTVGVTNGILALHVIQMPAFFNTGLHTVISGSPGNAGMRPGMRVAQLLILHSTLALGKF